MLQEKLKMRCLLKTYLKKKESLRSAFKESKAAEELTIDQYNKGVSTIFELLDAQSEG